MARQRQEDQKTANKLMAGTFRFIPKWLLWSVGILLGLLLLLFIASFFWMNRSGNRWKAI